MKYLYLLFLLNTTAYLGAQPPYTIQKHPDFGVVQDFIKTALTKKNVRNYARTIQLGAYTFDYFIFDRRIPNYDLKIYWKDDRGSARGNQYYSIENLNYRLGGRLLFATNGGMFDGQFVPKGLYVENGRVKKELDIQPNGFGNFYLQPNGVFTVRDDNFMSIQSTETFYDLYPNAVQTGSALPGIQYATQSGPMLVTNGQLNPAFRPGSENQFLRSGVGIIDVYRTVFIISRYNINFYDFASVFKDIFQCENALFLDGQVSKMLCKARPLLRSGEGGRFGTIIGISHRR
ncbi:MAG: phosphodiester glycosidase family protein [Bacteroidota bacterium]